MIRPLRFISAVVAAHLLSLLSVAQLAPSLFERAATGDATAMHLIGRASVSGGKPVEAYAWFSLAAEYGVETAEKSSLYSALSPAQVTEAARRVEEIRSTQLRGLPPPAKRPVARIVEATRQVEEGPVASPPAAPAVARPAPDGQAEAQKAQIASLEAELAAARSAMNDAKKQSDEQATKLEAAAARAGQERDVLAAEVSTLRRDKQRAEESLAQLQARPSPDSQIEALRAQIARLETDLAGVRAETSAAKAVSDEKATRLEAALAKAGQEKETLSAEINSLRQDRQRAEEARDKIRAELSADRSKLETDLAAAQTEARAAKQKAGEANKLEASLAQATRKRDALAVEIATLRRDKQRAEESLAEMRARPSLEGKVQEQSAQIAKLETELTAAQSEVRSARARTEESTARLEASLAEAAKERDALSGQVAALRLDKQRAEESLAKLKEQPALDGQVAAQKAQIARLEADLAAARTEAGNAKAKLAEVTKQLDAALARPSDDRDARAKEIASLKRERLAAEQARDQLRVEFATARQKLESDLAAARNEARIAKAYAAKLETDLENARTEARSGGAQFGGSANNLRFAPSRSPAPVDVPAPALPRVHSVDSGETLSSISQRYYGTPNRWREIFEANTDVMNSPNQLALGMRLRIP